MRSSRTARAALLLAVGLLLAACGRYGPPQRTLPPPPPVGPAAAPAAPASPSSPPEATQEETDDGAADRAGSPDDAPQEGSP